MRTSILTYVFLYVWFSPRHMPCPVDVTVAYLTQRCDSPSSRNSLRRVLDSGACAILSSVVDTAINSWKRMEFLFFWDIILPILLVIQSAIASALLGFTMSTILYTRSTFGILELTIHSHKFIPFFQVLED